VLQWPDIEPILRKTYELMEGSGRTSGQAVMNALALDDNDACSAFDALARGGFITVAPKMTVLLSQTGVASLNLPTLSEQLAEIHSRRSQPRSSPQVIFLCDYLCLHSVKCAYPD
jgi:hypothetical protein